MKSKFIFALLTLAFSSAVFANTFTAYSLESTDNKNQISPIPNQWTLIQLWALECEVCERQKPLLSQLNADYTDFAVIGLSIDGVENSHAVKTHIEKSDTAYPQYIDSLPALKAQLQDAFDTPFIGTPTYFLYSPQGKFITLHAGPLELESLPEQLRLNKRVP